jgi:hypothetical protein
MKRSILGLLVLPAFVFASACSEDATGPSGPPDMKGNYSYAINLQGAIFSGQVAITQQNGSGFSGTYTETSGSYPLSGTIDGTTVSFVIQPPGITLNNNGTYSNRNVTGTYVATLAGSPGTVQGSFTLTRL